ncbi:Synaptotagmin-3 [Dionaea muscipula]
MGFLSTLFAILGFGIGLPLGLLVGFFFFVYSKPRDVKDPVIRPIQEMDKAVLQELMPEMPNWIKSPDYERVDWLNKFIWDMWPYLDKAICNMIRSSTQSIFAEYIGMYQIQEIEFEKLSLGTLPPTFHGMKVYDTNENELLLEPTLKWAGNPDIVLVVKILSVRIRFQLVDLQVFAAPRICLKPLVPTFPCFSNIAVSLIEKPHVDFGLNLLGGDIMSIPGLYRFIQKTIQNQVANLYHWPQLLEIPILSKSATKKPVGILHVKVVRALKLLKMDVLGTSDPYVKLSLTGEKLPAKKTSIKMRNLNPEWNENFKLIVKDPETQLLELQVYDWDKVGGHDRLGMQLVPLKQLIPGETKEFTLDLLKNANVNDSNNKRPRGKLVVELKFDPFKYDNISFKSFEDKLGKKESGVGSISFDAQSSEAGVLLVTIIGAEDVEGEHHTNPYCQILFRGEVKKTKVIHLGIKNFQRSLLGSTYFIFHNCVDKKIQTNSCWNEEKLGAPWLILPQSAVDRPTLLHLNECSGSTGMLAERVNAEVVVIEFFVLSAGDGWTIEPIFRCSGILRAMK